MDDAFLHELLVANEPEEKAAIVAEYGFNMLSEAASLIARRSLFYIGSMRLL
jgi:hypothetical protein